MFTNTPTSETIKTVRDGSITEQISTQNLMGSQIFLNVASRCVEEVEISKISKQV